MQPIGKQSVLEMRRPLLLLWMSRITTYQDCAAELVNPDNRHAFTIILTNQLWCGHINFYNLLTNYGWFCIMP